jgi:hypothetical protein
MHTALPEHQLKHQALHAPAAALPELANPGGPPFLSAYFQSQDHDSGELSSLRLNVNSTFSEIYADDGAAVAFSGTAAGAGAVLMWRLAQHTHSAPPL